MIEQFIKEDKGIIERFATLNQTGRLAHAYLFVGPKEIGKTQTAIALAKLINCEANEDGKLSQACEQCAACRKITSGNHVDVMILDQQDEQFIKIGQIRDLINRTQLRPFEARKKVFIVRNIEALTLEGSNALLKTLEEPTADSLLILTTSVLEKVLPTVRSRCHIIAFFATTRERVASGLLEAKGISDEDASILGYVSEGCLAKAQRLNQDDFIARKNTIIDEMVFSPNSEVFIKQTLTDKAGTREVLDVLLLWFRDCLLIQSGVHGGQIVNIDRLNELKESARKYEHRQIQSILEAIVNTTHQLNENLNVKIPLILVKEKIWVN